MTKVREVENEHNEEIYENGYKNRIQYKNKFQYKNNFQNEYEDECEDEYNEEYEDEYEDEDEYKDKSKGIANIFGNFGDYYILYQRSKIEFTDVLATIGALFSTVNFIFSSVYKYYSKNFDKYKIIEKIFQTSQLNKKTIPLNKNINNLNQIELTNINIIKPDLNHKLEETTNENKNNQNDKNNLLNPLIHDDDLKEEIEQSFPDNDMDNENGSLNNRYMPKLSFYDFFYNNVYCTKCKKNKKQELLNLCNKIILKYSSIDLILLYMMRLEKTFPDQLKESELNNDLFKDLISYLK